MGRAELIRKLDTIIDIGIVNAKHDSDVLKHVMKILKKYTWIPAETPPNDNRFVLCLCDDKSIRTGQYNKVLKEWGVSCFSMKDIVSESPNVVRWMELPEVPKEDA